MKHVKMFGKSIPIAAILAIVMISGVGVYAAVVNYLSNTVTEKVGVKSPIELSGSFTYQTIRYEASVIDTPSIDGVISSGEWGDSDFSNYYGETLLYDVYLLSDADYLYVAFEAGGGDFTIASSMTNIYIYAGDDWGGECWAYSVAGWVGETGLDYFTIHHLPDPKVKEGKEARDTDSIVAISATVMEWKIPLSEFPMNLGPISFDFMSFSEGWSNNPNGGSWAAAWLYEQYYTLGKPVVVTETFLGTKFSEALYGGSWFSMSFEAKNLANSDMDITLGLVMVGPSAWTPGIADWPDEISVIEPVADLYDYVDSNKYYVVAYDLGSIVAGKTVGYDVTKVQLTPIAEPGLYTIKAVVVWSDVSPDATYIVTAAGLP